MMCKMYKSAYPVYVIYTDNIEKINKSVISISMFVTIKIQRIKVLKQKSVDSLYSVWYNFFRDKTLLRAV